MITTIKEMMVKRPALVISLFIILFYFLPTLIQVNFNEEMHIEIFYLGLPGMLSGDEPHYFVITTSLINDNDYFVGNNYDNAYLYGTCDVGYRFANNTDKSMRHIRFFHPEKKEIFSENPYDPETEELNQEIIKEIFAKYNITNAIQVSSRPLGLSFFSALFLWPFKGTCWIEYGAIYLTMIVSLLGILLFYVICRHYVEKYRGEEPTNKEQNKGSKKLALLFTIIFALCTPIWHYGKTYFSEPYLTVFLLAAYYLFFIQKKSFIPGLLLAIGFTMKYPFGMFLAFFGLSLLYYKEWKRIFYFVIGALGPIVAVLYYNWNLTGNFILARSEYLTFFDNYFAGVVQAMFNPIYGIIPFAPFLIFSIPAVQILYRRDKKTLGNFILLFIPYFLFWSSLALTPVGGGGSYAARYDLPLLFIPVLLTMIWYMHNKNTFLRKIFYLLIILSFIINILAAFLYPLFWSNPPWIVLTTIFYKWDRVMEIVINLL